jgi:peroxiredoxin
MKNHSIVSKNLKMLAILVGLSLFAGSTIQAEQNSGTILLASLSKLNSLKSIAYQSQHSGNYTNGKHLSSSSVYLEFFPEDTLIGAKFEIDHSKDPKHPGIIVYDGHTLSEYYIDHEYLVTTNPTSSSDLTSHIHISSSILKTKFILDLIVKGEMSAQIMPDTMISEKFCWHFLITIPIDKPAYGPLYHELFISKQDTLPVRLAFYGEKYNVATEYSAIVLNRIRSEETWSEYRFPSSISRMTEDELYSKKKKLLSEMEQKEAPDWSFQTPKGDTISLSDHRGKFVLLEFFAAGCGAHITSIPEINNIQNKLHGLPFRVIGIETNEMDASMLAKYAEKNKIQYPLVMGNQEIANRYFVWASPSYFLIKPDGMIVYASTGLYINKLSQTIDFWLGE